MEASSFRYLLVFVIGCESAPTASSSSATPVLSTITAPVDVPAPVTAVGSAPRPKLEPPKMAAPCAHASKDDRWVRRILAGISRAAADHYERDGALCTSAADAPANIPKGSIAPDEAPGLDFESGDELGGWRCLRYAITQPVAYRYGYRISDFRGPPRGLPDPGPHGFEASAEADLDGDGKTSLYTMVGSLTDSKLTVNPAVYCVDPAE